MSNHDISPIIDAGNGYSRVSCSCGWTKCVPPAMQGSLYKCVGGHLGGIQRKRNAPEHIWTRGVRTEAGCLEWTGALTEGYGKTSIGGKDILVHRLAYELAKGEIPGDLTVDHICRNTKCFNPDHLRLLTAVDNVMAGEGPAAQNIRKTHCPQGHEYDRTWISPNGRPSRQCSICQAAADKRHKEKRKNK